MDLASKLCSFALTQAASLVWTDHSPSSSPDSKRARTKDIGSGAKTASAVPTRRRRKVVRLEIKGSVNSSQTLKCQQLAPISAASSAAGSNRKPKYRLPKSSNGGRHNRWPLRPLPTIKEEEDLMYLEDVGGYQFYEQSDNSMNDRIAAAKMDYRRTSYWEDRLRSRDSLPSCVDSRLQ